MSPFSGKDGKTDFVYLNNLILPFEASILYLFILGLKNIIGLAFLFFLDQFGYPFPPAPGEYLSPDKTFQ